MVANDKHVVANRNSFFLPPHAVFLALYGHQTPGPFNIERNGMTSSYWKASCVVYSQQRLTRVSLCDPRGCEEVSQFDDTSAKVSFRVNA